MKIVVLIIIRIYMCKMPTSQISHSKISVVNTCVPCQCGSMRVGQAELGLSLAFSQPVSGNNLVSTISQLCIQLCNSMYNHDPKSVKLIFH